MEITDKQIEQITQMSDNGETESKIIDWIDSQENAQDIYDWFNQVMQGYATEKA